MSKISRVEQGIGGPNRLLLCTAYKCRSSRSVSKVFDPPKKKDEMWDSTNAESRCIPISGNLRFRELQEKRHFDVSVQE